MLTVQNIGVRGDREMYGGANRASVRCVNPGPNAKNALQLI